MLKLIIFAVVLKVKNMRVKEICKEKGLTLRQLANKMDTLPESLSRAISDKGNPTKSTMQEIAKALGVPLAELFINPTSGVITCPSCGTKLELTIKQ